MKVRLAILVVVLAVVIGYVFTRPPVDKPSQGSGPDEGPTVDGPVGVKTPVQEMDIPGEAPDAPAELEVQIIPEINDAGQMRLNFQIVENNGFFVETFRVDYYFSLTGFRNDPGHKVDEFFINDFVTTNGTLAASTSLTAEERKLVGSEEAFLDPENWDAEITWHGRVRLEDPPEDWLGWKTRNR